MTQQTYTPDWSKAPPQANWWARDKDGSGFWYSKRPSARRHSFIAYCCFVAADNDCPFIDCSFELDNWRDTLTVRPFQDRDIPQNLSDYFTGKTPFITAYVDLLLARMAKEGRFSDDDSQSSNDLTVNDLITFQSRDSDFTCFAIVDKTKNILVWASRVVELSGGERRHRTGTIIDFEEQNARTITELEAVEFRKAMEAVYG